MQRALILLIRIYKNVVSRYLKSQCKFYPTCSEYAILSIKKYGSLKGIWKTILRLLRCNPFSSGGVDFP
ncbi:MAG: membrane protein insertion efficiency factor YidD [Holosporaceae bacterium]|jgi:putative membrane protein insertion efficiency factor|nr:membrane protein insertion efficiency factor YidD [Holosporaceae bacterium]